MAYNWNFPSTVMEIEFDNKSKKFIEHNNFIRKTPILKQSKASRKKETAIKKTYRNQGR